MRWGLRDILTATTALVLILVARVLGGNNYFYQQWTFLFAFYFAIVVATAILAWQLSNKWKAPLAAYAIFCGLYGTVIFSERDVSFGEELLRMCGAGILIGVACAMAVGIVMRINRKV